MQAADHEVIDMTLAEFISAYCQASEAKRALGTILPAVFSDAHSDGASAIYVSGSFITEKEQPGDIDLLIVHKNAGTIPTRPNLPHGVSIPIDAQFASLDEPEILSAFLQFLTTHRSGKRVPIIRIPLVDHLNHPTLSESDPSVLRAIKHSYGMRHISENKRVLVTIHGILTHAPWNAELSRLASAQGWIVAPYLYGFTTPLVLVSKRIRLGHVAKFREWLDGIQKEHGGPISVVAHSFGTYIIGRYLTGWDNGPPIKIKSLILTGSILSEHIVWNSKLHGVERVHNEVGLQDNWVSMIPLISWLSGDDPIGRAGRVGFKNGSDILTESAVPNFNHSNPLSTDVISGRWLPYLNFWNRPTDDE
jgi:pimeloyl-ACP methyl ester carboxylesterase